MKNNSAQTSIDILQFIKDKCGIESMAYLVLPNVILTLNGERAYCDGVFWSNDDKKLEKWHKEAETLIDEFKKTIKVLFAKSEIVTARKNDKYLSIEFVLEAGLQKVINGSSLTNLTYQDLEDSKNADEMVERIVSDLSKQPKSKGFNKENLNHVAFGILLGYPDQAIIESVPAWDNYDDPFSEPLVDADIRGASYYTCPQPKYSYPRSLINHPVINSHEKRWSKVLKDFYSSEFHTSLNADSNFMQKMKELKNYS